MLAPVVVRAEGARVNLVCIKDVHAAAVPPGRRRGDYGEQILGKLEWVSRLAHHVHGNVICAGDLFHIKNGNHPSNALPFITRLMSVLQMCPTEKMYGVVGNHDITSDNLGSLPKQPLGNLIMAGAYWDLSHTPVIFQTDDGLRVRVDGYDYEADARVIYDAIRTARPDTTCQYRMAVLHCFGTPGPSQPMFGEYAIGFDDLVGTPYDAFLWGHDHKPKGIVEVGAQKHLYLGSLSRAALTADEAERQVTVPVISFGTDEIKVLEREVPTTPLELAFHTATLNVDKVDARMDVRAQHEATVQFLAGLQGHAEACESEDPKEILLSITQDFAIIEEVCNACDLH